MKKLIIILILFFVCISVEAKNTKKVQKEFRKRNAYCLALQEEQQRNNIKHYSARKLHNKRYKAYKRWMRK